MSRRSQARYKQTDRATFCHYPRRSNNTAETGLSDIAILVQQGERLGSAIGNLGMAHWSDTVALHDSLGHQSLNATVPIFGCRICGRKSHSATVHGRCTICVPSAT